MTQNQKYSQGRLTGKFDNGEHFLIGGRPGNWGFGPDIPPAYFYKKRYTWDGDPEYIGCTIGCSFCYYRWIDSTESTIGNGRENLRRIGDPELAAHFLGQSKLFRPERDIVLLCARSDASVQVESCTRFLKAFHHDTPVFFLHRGVFGRRQLEAWGPDSRVIFSTTLTPVPPGTEKGSWTPVKTERQIDGLKFLLANGIPANRLSIMTGPFNSNNVEQGVAMIRELGDMGIPYITYRGCSVGNIAGTDDEKQLRQEGFLDGAQDEKAAPAGHQYYQMKNWLAEDVEAALLRAMETAGMRNYRFTGTLYEGEFGRVVARNRNNKYRPEIGPWVKVEILKLDAFLRWLGFHPESVAETEKGYFVTLPQNEFATEDIAMTVGAEFATSVLFNNHRIAPTIGDLRFYAANKLFWPLPEGWEQVVDS
jgi:hypothetical protein